MKRYFLFGYGDFSDKAIVTYILDAMSDVTDSDFLKYKSYGTSIVLHFGNSQEFSKLNEYVNIVMSKCSSNYFLVEYTDNMSVNMTKEELDVFLIITKEDLDSSMKKYLNNTYKNDIKDKMSEFNSDMIKLFINLNDNEDIECEDDDEDQLIKHSNKPNYTIDDILDKINSKGIKSLTQEELTYLNSFSK